MINKHSESTVNESQGYAVRDGAESPRRFHETEDENEFFNPQNK